jgi:hypothetical protein
MEIYEKKAYFIKLLSMERVKHFAIHAALM